MFGIPLAATEMDVEVTGPRISGKSIGQAEKIYVTLGNGKNYTLYVENGELIKEERNEND